MNSRRDKVTKHVSGAVSASKHHKGYGEKMNIPKKNEDSDRDLDYKEIVTQ
jgi:hypothetical protein